MMPEEADSSESSDEEEGSLYMVHRRKVTDTPRTSISVGPGQFKSVITQDSTASLTLSLKSIDMGDIEADRHGSIGGNFLSLKGKDSDSGDSLQGSLQGSRRGSYQGSRRGSYQGSQPGSRSGSPFPDDYVIVSKDKRSSTILLDDWMMIEGGQSGDEENVSEDNKKDSEDMEQKKLYLLVARCVAYPFNAKYQIENCPPPAKLNSERFGHIYRTLRATVEDFQKIARECQSKLTAQENDIAKSKNFRFCVQWMLDVVLACPEVVDMIKNGGFSAKELEAIFKIKAVTLLTDAKNDVKSSEVSLWCCTFRKIVEQCSRAFVGRGSPTYQTKASISSGTSSAAVPNQDKLYKLFQQILKIRSIEHQVLYRECKLGNPEEQEAVVRRELQARKKMLDRNIVSGGDKFGSRKVEEIYREEQHKMLKHLNNNLDQLSLQGGSNIGTIDRKKKKGIVSESGNMPVSKQDLHFNLKIKVTIHEITEIQPAYEGKNLFCVFGLLEGGGDPLRTQPVEPEYASATFGEEGEFWVHSPTPMIKLELRSVSKGLLRDSKLIAKHVHTAVPSSIDLYSTIGFYLTEKDLKKDSNTPPVAKLKISTIVERPSSIKKCGYLVAVGDSMFKQCKRRFFTLIQLSQYKFLLCSYQPNGTQPKDSVLLDGLTVEYASDDGPLKDELDAKFVFDLVFERSEMGRIHFGCRDDAERQSWIEWMVRGTGQSYQPQQLGVQEVMRAGSTDLERYGLKKVVDSVNDITSMDFHKLFIRLFRTTLEFRLSEDVFSRGLFSPPQMYVLDEFCARYGIRDPFRHLTCLQDWLDHLENGVSIWPVMIQSSFRFCQMHVGGMNPPEKSVIVTTEEREVFVEVCQRIEEVVVYQLQNFRIYFPFCCPKADLRTTLKLFDLVSTINHSSRGSMEDSPLKLLTLSMEKAALINYKQVYSKLEFVDSVQGDPLPMTKLFDLAKLCIEFMYELHDFYWEEFNQSKVFSAHINAFWSFFLVDMREAMARDDDIILKLQLFHILNHYFSSQSTMMMEEFHCDFLKEFTPVVISYIDTLEQTLKKELAVSLAHETWLPVTLKCCGAIEGAMNSLLSFKRFLNELSWPEESFAAFLDQKVAAISADRFQEAAEVIQVQFSSMISSGKGSSLNYTLKPQSFTMINTLVYLSAQVMQVCASQRIQLTETQNESTLEFANTLNIEEHLSSILNATLAMAINKLCTPIKDILTKLNKFDPSEGFLASLKMMIPTHISTDAFAEFLSSNLTLISTHLVTTIFNNFVVNWYECQMQLLSQWLEKRPEFSLHPIQLSSTQTLFKTLYESFLSCDVSTGQLESETYDTVQNRIRVENSHIDLLSVGKS